MLNRLTVILGLLLLCSCVEDTSSTITTEVLEVVEGVVEEAPSVPVSYLLPNTNYSWQGNLDGRYPVLIWYRQIDSVITGSLFYTDKSATPILLVGVAHGDSIELVEHLSNGKVTGVWLLEPGMHSIEGKWKNPINGDELSASLMKIDSAVGIYGLNKGQDISGEYHYHYGDDDAPMGNLTVKQIGTGSAVLRFENVGSGPAHNMGFIESDTLLIEGNTVHFSTQEYGGCSLELKFFNEFVHVSYVDNEVSCGLGHNVYLNGTYIKMK